jgi:predicted MFS family arabinose efflux permease
MGRLSGRLGPLVERDFRLLFTATTITTIGDRLAFIALAFAVLDLPGATATDFGIVLAARQVTEALVLVGGGVLSDRLPRQYVLVGASLIQASSQAITATLILTDNATVAMLVGLQALYGVGGGLVVPAEVGLVPQTVSPARLQQANAWQGLSRNLVGILGPALGGALVVAGSPGTALALDSVSFVICAVLLGAIRVPPRDRSEQQPSFVRELREGWREFTSRTWLWSTVILFGIGNMAFAGWFVLGPVIAKEDLGGAGAWATIVTVGGIGAVLGGLLAMRIRPSRPLVACILAATPLTLQLVFLALGAPVWALSIASFLGGMGLAVHLTLWFTVFQREIPEQAQSRVSSYDALGSFVLIPLGAVLVGPLAAAVGIEETLLGGAAIGVACWIVMLLIPDVWSIRARRSDPVPHEPVVVPESPAEERLAFDR